MMRFIYDASPYLFGVAAGFPLFVGGAWFLIQEEWMTAGAHFLGVIAARSLQQVFLAPRVDAIHRQEDRL